MQTLTRLERKCSVGWTYCSQQISNAYDVNSDFEFELQIHVASEFSGSC